MSDVEIVKEFLVESYENLDHLDQELIALEKNPTDPQILASIFRTIHTIKGTSGFLAFNKLGALAHVGENLLARLRDRQLTLNPEITTALLKMVDAVRQMLGSIETAGSEGERDDEALIAELSRLLQPIAEAAQAPSPTPAKEEESPKYESGQPVPNMGDILIKQGAAKVSEVFDALSEQGSGDPRHLGEILVAQGAVKPNDVVEALNIQQQASARGPAAGDSTIRVDVSLLDQLMNLVGELVLARNQVLQFTNTIEEKGLLATSQRLNLITTELQEGVMKTRMQPIGNIWSKFPRTVRDVALGCGKEVRIEMEGKDTELDKTIIEAIKDPLTHLVRNAVDHGIEAPEKRKALGKPVEGLLSLRAFHEGGQVNIEISDDGAGLNRERIIHKAVQKGLITSDQAARLSDREVSNLVFLPGLSTAEKVTNVSGRGVGLDVVKTNIEKIGGTVDVQSRPGLGSTVRLKIPLTLAIIPALIVTSGGDRYAIPQVSLLELVRLEGEQASKGIELVHGAPVHRLRGRLLPLVYLNRELKTGTNDQTQKGNTSGGDLDFSAVRDKHRQWVDTLQQVIQGKIAMTVQQGGSHESCALGKWIYGSALKDFGAIEEMHVLEKAHKEFHQHVRNVIQNKSDGHESLAHQELESVARISHRIMELTTTVERKVLECQNANIVVLQADDRPFGLVVDEINDTEEIVVKPLSKQLKSIKTFAGATIMGDGKVALILDVMGLAQYANVVTEVRDHALAEKEGDRVAALRDTDRRNSVLLFQHGENGRMAIDLSAVARLEEFACNTIEVAGGQEVVQYRGQIMPLIRVSDVIEANRTKIAGVTNQSVQVVVYDDKGHSVGLVVDRILDIAEESFAIQRQSGKKGILGSAVIGKHVTDILDVPRLIEATTGAELSQGAHA